jgi:hypothetical protein
VSLLRSAAAAAALPATLTTLPTLTAALPLSTLTSLSAALTTTTLPLTTLTPLTAALTTLLPTTLLPALSRSVRSHRFLPVGEALGHPRAAGRQEALPICNADRYKIHKMERGTST